jgi:hypothetical protein
MNIALPHKDGNEFILLCAKKKTRVILSSKFTIRQDSASKVAEGG